jgi:hypothetical protein
LKVDFGFISLFFYRKTHMGWTPESLADAEENRIVMEGEDGAFAHLIFTTRNSEENNGNFSNQFHKD